MLACYLFKQNPFSTLYQTVQTVFFLSFSSTFMGYLKETHVHTYLKRFIYLFIYLAVLLLCKMDKMSCLF